MRSGASAGIVTEVGLSGPLTERSSVPGTVAFQARMGLVRGLVQRVAEARVTVGDEVVGEIGAGLCVLVGVHRDDTEAQARKLADKVWGLRIMADDDGVMNRSVADTTGDVLVVSQFTLYGNTERGRRPSWLDAAPPEHAEPLVDLVVVGAAGRWAPPSPPAASAPTCRSSSSTTAPPRSCWRSRWRPAVVGWCRSLQPDDGTRASQPATSPSARRTMGQSPQRV